MSPPFRPKGTRRCCGAACRRATCTPRRPTTAPSAPRRRRRARTTSRKIPNGCGGVEERMAVIWDAGVNSGRLTPSEFVAVTSANCAKLFNIYPRKGCVVDGADADLVVWDPQGTQDDLGQDAALARSTSTSSRAARCAASPSHTVSRGKLVYAARRPACRSAAPAATSSGRPSAPNFEALRAQGARPDCTPTAVRALQRRHCHGHEDQAAPRSTQTCASTASACGTR